MDPRQHLARRAAIVTVAAVGALGAFGATPAAAASGLSVSASVTGCSGSPRAGTITCNVDVAFGSVPGAVSYTAEVIRPDGSTQSFGQVGPAAASLPVSYVGNGEYVVTISAWGDPEGQADKRVIDKDRSG
jgi:hypothetical protein